MKASPANGGGTAIVVRIGDGEKFSRAFERNAFFQEVYDWIGSLVEVPLHFTLQRGREVNTEMINLEHSLVSFKGNYPSDQEELSETMEGKNKNGERKEDKKRRDKRSHKGRKGKKKRKHAKQ